MKVYFSPLILIVGQGQTQNTAQYHLHHITYSPAKFEVSMSNGIGGNTFTRNIQIHEALPSASCDLCTCNVRSCYSQLLRGCIYKKKHYLTLTPRSKSYSVFSYKCFFS